jgi:tRNA-Thr(GGU) m(6)t(6)A37 methyltransferase TsaA
MSRYVSQITVQPIGRVVASEAADRSQIEVWPEFAAGLDGVEEHDHLWVLYWMHQLRDHDRRVLKAHPRGDTSKPMRGVFALHSPMRPNPIGMTRVRLLRRDANVLTVGDLDAEDGTPVLDIKSG